MASSRVEVDFLDVLDACIADVRAGRQTLEGCLDEFPEHRSELEALLSAVAAIVPVHVTPDPARKLRARFDLVEELHRRRASAGLLGWLAALRPRLAGVALAALLAVGGSSAAVVAAQDAQPTDPLYGLKTAIEQQQVALTASPDARAQLRVRIAERRLAEAERAIASGREDVAVSVAGAYSDAMQRAYQDIDVTETGGGSAAAAADDTAARLQAIAARANDAGEREAAAALLQAGERAERDRAGAQRKSTQPVTTQSRPAAPVAQVRPPAVSDAVVEPEMDVVEAEAPDDQSPVVTQQPPAPSGPAPAAVVIPPPAIAQQGRAQAGGAAGPQRGAADRDDQRENNGREDRDDDRGRGAGNQNNDRPNGEPTPGRSGQLAVATFTPTPGRTLEPTTTDRDRDDRGGRGQNGQGRGDDDQRDAPSSRTPTPSARGAPSGDERTRPIATPVLRGELRAQTPTRSSSNGGGDGDRDRDNDRGSNRD